MKAMRGLAILVLGPLVAVLSFNRNEIEKRAGEIRKRNAQNERDGKRMAAQLVRETWHLKGSDWFGRMADGRVFRLESPQVSATTLKEGRPYCCRWFGEISVKADRWDFGATPEKEPFVKTYTVLVTDSKRAEILENTGPKVTRAEPCEHNHGPSAGKNVPGPQPTR
jgi:hypothetical protein